MHDGDPDRRVGCRPDEIRGYVRLGKDLSIEAAAGEDSSPSILDIPSRYPIHSPGSRNPYAYQPRSGWLLRLVREATYYRAGESSTYVASDD